MKAFLILNLSNRLEVGGQLHAPAALPNRKEPKKTLNRQLGVPPGRTAIFGVKKNASCPLAEIEPRVLGGPARILVTTLTAMPQ
jgi:hypothetical protein